MFETRRYIKHTNRMIMFPLEVSHILGDNNIIRANNSPSFLFLISKFK